MYSRLARHLILHSVADMIRMITARSRAGMNTALTVLGAFVAWSSASAQAGDQKIASEQPPKPPSVQTRLVEASDPAPAIPDLIPTKDFASRSVLWDADLAPDGTAMSFIKREEKKFQLITLDPRTKAPINQLTFAPGTVVDWTR